MSARSDLDNALQYLSDGITAHVAALASAKAAHAAALDTASVALSAANDDAYITGITSKVLQLCDALSLGGAAPAALPKVTPVEPTPAPTDVTVNLPAPAPVTPPAAPVAAEVTPVAPQTPVAAPEPAKPQTLMEMMASVAKLSS